MTTRQHAAIVAGLALAVTMAGQPVPAQAAIPRAAQNWSSLMYRSLTAGSENVRLRKVLAAERTTVRTRVAEVARARTAETTAQARLTAAGTAHTAARTRLTAATQTLGTAKKTLRKVSRQRPRSTAAITRAKNTVAAATKTVATRTEQVKLAATALQTARAGARAATTGLATATTAWTTATTAAQRTEQRIAGLGTATAHATRAAALSRDVVTQVRAGFAMADTTAVYGVTVHKTVAFSFRRMVDDARADGIAISGGGFRTKQRQIELRTINGCPDVWTAPASSCRVPTAIPGRSLHEIALAVDITSGGRSLTAKSPAFAWMVKNGKRYGFVNLPSEPWHWSITGG